MYRNTRSNFRYSSNRSTGRRNFSGRSFSGRPAYGRPKSQLINEVGLFIKKALDSSIEETVTSKSLFSDLPISDSLKNNISRRGYIHPTPIQDSAITPILEGRDVIGMANTGTGKTAAFLIPLIEKILQDRHQKILVIVPTRELALQIQNEFRYLAEGLNLYSTIIIGGANIVRQISEVRRHPHLVVATPGRLKDLIERRVVNLLDYQNIVLDEVDLMVDIGFIADVKYFISLMPKVRQSLFFSATISNKVKEILNAFVYDPISISVKTQDTALNIDQDVVRVSSGAKKLDTLHDLLIQTEFKKVLIFGETKHSIDRLSRDLDTRGFKIGVIHGNKSQGQRKRALEGFKRDEFQILLATDVAARGLDIDKVSHVINYDLPKTYDDYIHRIGRTGRAGSYGIALTFVNA